MKILIEVNAPGWNGSIPAAPDGESMDLQLMAYIKALVKSRIEREPEVQLSIVSDEYELVKAEALLRLQKKATGLNEEEYRRKLREHYDEGED